MRVRGIANNYSGCIITMSSDVDDLVGTNRKSSVTDFFPDFYENNLS